MVKEEKYGGSGIYGIYDVTKNKIYVGASSNIQSRFAQHRSNFRSKSKANPMYQEPIEHFVFLVLYKMSKKDFAKHGRMFEDLFIASAIRDSMKLYNQNKVNGDATGSVLFSFGIYDRIKESIHSEIGYAPWMLNMMKMKNRMKVLERMKGGC